LARVLPFHQKTGLPIETRLTIIHLPANHQKTGLPIETHLTIIHLLANDASSQQQLCPIV
jgi:hypothetical protein